MMFVMSAGLWAHFPNAEFFAVGFTAAGVPTIDGDLSDWDLVPEEYWVTMENDFEETRRGVGTDFDFDDLNMKLIIGWAPSTNRIYSYLWVSDNIMQSDKRAETARFNYDDESHFVVDADHSGGPIYGAWNDLPEDEWRRLEATTAQLYSTIVPPIDGYWSWIYQGQWWLTQSGQGSCCADLLQIGWQMNGQQGGTGVWHFEHMVTPWEHLDFDGQENSTIFTLAEGGTIGIGYLWKDYDNSDIYEGSFDFPKNHDVWLNADLMADFELLAPDEGLTAVEASSWGRIKATFE
jgi:hypothetical protein